MSDEKQPVNIANRRVSKENSENVSIAVSADKTKGVVRVQFAKPISWLELDPLGCANMMKFLGDKLKELQT